MVCPQLMQYTVFNLRARSLVRGTMAVMGSLLLALLLAGFPDIHPSPLLVLPMMCAVYGTWETSRCLRRRWDFYHGGVLLLLYADILALSLILFMLLYPYMQWLQGQ